MQKHALLYVLLGTVMMLLLGIVYSYSMFRLEIERLYDLSAFESGLPYMFSLFFYALFMAIGGRWLQQYSTVNITLLGAFLIGGGFVLAGVWTSLLGLVISYGVLIGSGVGLLYGLPLRIVSQLQVAKPGLLMGITLMGFGLSPLIFAPVVNSLITKFGLNNTFFTLGITYTIVLTILLLLLSKRDTAEKKTLDKSYPMIQEPSFYLVYGLFFIGTLIGLTIIGFTGDIGVDRIQLSKETVALYMGLFAVLNGVGRPLFGYLNDHYGFVKTASASFLLLMVVSVILLISESSVVLFVISFSVIYIVFGGWLSLAPGATIQLFGRADYSKNYGVMFTAYGLGALLGNGLGGLLVDAYGYVALFAMLGMMALLGFVILLWKQSYIKQKS
jgi:predicted MFS family arabinose efflux permease